VRREKRETANRRGEACAHWWWWFSRPDGTAGGSADGHEELFHGCCLRAAMRAVTEGVLPGPRQASRRAASPVAFAAPWKHVGGYIGPSATGKGHVGCALAVDGKATRANNPHYRHAGTFAVSAVLLRPWTFDERLEITHRQSYANQQLNPYQWDGGRQVGSGTHGAGGSGDHTRAQAGGSNTESRSTRVIGTAEQRRRDASIVAMLRGERAPITWSVARRDAAGNPLGQSGVGKEPAGGWGTAAPSEEDIAQATIQAERRWLPTIVQPELCYGWFQKKQGTGLWCRWFLASAVLPAPAGARRRPKPSYLN
jgi:hypothetical protein